MSKTLFENILSITKQFSQRYIAAFLMLVVSNGLLVINPLILRQALMALQLHPASSILFWVITLLTVAAVSSFFKYWMRVTFIGISRDVEQEIRSTLFEKIQSQSRAFFDRHGIGDLISRLSNDIAAYRDVLGPGVMYPAYCLTLIVPGLAGLFYISPLMASISLLPILCIPLLNLFVRRTLFQSSLDVQHALGEMSNISQEYFSGIRIVKGYEIEDASLSRFKQICRRFARLNMFVVFVQGLFFPFLSLITRITIVLLVLLAGVGILKGWETLNAADFVSFMWIQSYIFFPVIMLGWVLPIYVRGVAAYQRIQDILSEPIEVQGSVGSELKIMPKADISFSDLSFSYPKAMQESLSHVDLTIKGGTFVGITGPVGSGKTTLFRLLTREYAIPRGMIAIGGYDINDYALDTFFQEMVTVEQVPFLFSRTIADNILFGKQEATRDQLDVVMKQADLHNTVMEFPLRYETVVGERGVSLSGGQKQRVAMARAFLVNRSILLLDDIFSAVDAGTEKRIFDAMKENFQGKTILLITHRTSILKQMDRVLYLSRGRVEEDGLPGELLKLNGFYTAMTSLQER